MIGATPRILLIEDEQSIGFIYKRQLDLAGMQTDTFTTGKLGLEAFGRNSYDVVLLDIMLPDTNGLEILKEIRKDNKNAHVIIIMLTNLGQDSVIKEGMTIGANGYLIKANFTPTQLVAEVKNILAQNKAPQSSDSTKN